MLRRNGKQIVTDIRVHLIESGVEPQYWPYLLKHVVVLMNSLPKQRLTTSERVMTPLEAWSGTVPNLSGVRQTGCLVYYFDNKYKERLVEMDRDGVEVRLGKWNQTGLQGTLLGLADASGVNYHIIKHLDGQVAVVTNVRFVEDVKPCMRVTEHERELGGGLDIEEVNEINLVFPDPVQQAVPMARPVPRADQPARSVASQRHGASEQDAEFQDYEDLVELEVPQAAEPERAQPALAPLGRPQAEVAASGAVPAVRPVSERRQEADVDRYDPLSKGDDGVRGDDPEWVPPRHVHVRRPRESGSIEEVKRPARELSAPDLPVAAPGREGGAPSPAARTARQARPASVARDPGNAKGGLRPPAGAGRSRELRALGVPEALPGNANGELRPPAGAGRSRELRALGVPETVPSRRTTQGRPPLRLGQPYGYVQSVAASAAAAVPSPSGQELPDLQTLRLKESEIVIPTTWADVQASPLRPYWLRAYEAEVMMWRRRGVFTIVNEDPSHVRLTCRPVCTVKAVDGLATRLKVRIVVRDFGAGREERFWSPTAECHTQRVLAAVAAARGMTVCRFDVVGAYLYARLEEPVKVRAPAWSATELMPPGCVLSLRKAVYGLREAAQDWNVEYDRTLVQYGWEPSIIDPALYVYRQKGDYMLATLHVDDFIVAHRQGGRFEHFLQFITKKYDMTYEPQMTKGVGVEWVQRKDHSLILHQRQYVEELVDRYRPLVRPVPTPTFSTPIVEGQGEGRLLTAAAATTYRALVGALLYLATRTRVDISYAVTSLSHHVVQPTANDMKDAMRVLQYLNGTREDGLRVTKAEQLTLKVFADAAWVSDNEANTWMGYIVMLNDTPIMWRSMLSRAKYPSVSSAEYVAMSNGWGRAEQAKRLLQSIGIDTPTVPVYSDSRVAIHNVVNGKCMEAVRHLSLRYHRVRAAHRDGDILITHVPSAEQPADVLTKRLDRIAFQRCKEAVMCVRPRELPV